MTLAALALAWLLGIAAAAFAKADPLASLAAAALFAAASFAYRPRPGTLALAAAGVALVLVAGWRYDATLPPSEPTGIARRNDGDAVRFRALIDSEPDDRANSTLYRLSVREASVDGGWQPESGRVLMRTAAFPRYAYGDLLQIEAELETPPSFEDFDYRDYLLRQGISSITDYPRVERLEGGHGNRLRAALIDLRSRLSGALSDALPEPEASLAAGVLLGARSDLPPDLRDDMNATGTSHLVAVSGQNVTILAGLLIALLAWLIGRRPAAWLALAGIAGYALLVGGQPSVVRAAVMGALYVVAIAFGRQSSAAVGLALAGAAMTAIDPQVARDVSFQLSFAATLGLITLAPPLRDRAAAALARWPAAAELPAAQAAIELFAVTLAAIAFTLPITAVNFHRVSLVAPVANLFAVPAFVLVAFTAAVVAVAGSIVPAGGDWLAWLAWPPAAYMVGAVRFFAALPLASVELPGIGAGHAIAYYAVLAACVWLLARRPSLEPAAQATVAPPATRPLIPAGGLALVMGLASILLWLAVTMPTEGRLSVTFLDVGQGEAILIEGPAGQRILVDGGPSDDALAPALGRHLAFYDRRIDLVVLTHPQADHLGGLPWVLGRYDVGGVLAGPVEGDSGVYREWVRALQSSAVPATDAARGRWIDLGGGARLVVIGPTAAQSAPNELNEASLVLKLSMGDISLLLTSDIGAPSEEDLLESGADLRADVLKVGHHGSTGSSTPAFVFRVQPIVDVISVGAGNSYGHPAPEVLERLAGDLVLRTDLHGDVTLATDGEHLWLRTQRGLD